jgi:uncharacterized protein (TIGR02145 family)
MRENLKTTKYRDGTDIPNITGSSWTTQTTGAYCWYDDNIGNKSSYGALYNYYTVVDNRNLCPTGWHVPTDEELKTLEKSLGMTQAQADAYDWRGTDQGTQLKSTSDWFSGGNGTNSSGFNVLPGGYRWDNGTFENMSMSGNLWSTSEGNSESAKTRVLTYEKTTVYRTLYLKVEGFSVRCLQGEGQVLSAVTTNTVTSITSTTATSGGNVTSDGGAAISARGVCWSTSTNPLATGSHTSNGTGEGVFTSLIIGLTPNTLYYVRAYATNSAGTAYGNQNSFTTSITITDIDGNIYNTVQIGTQLWMKENLKTTRYNDNTVIPNVTDDATWGGLSTGAYCWYNNEAPTYKNIYGGLYNWYAVNTGKLCPTSWHVPTDAEWTILTTFLGGESVAGGKLKETGTAHWTSPNTGATNETGFTALPGGYRYYLGAFGSIANFGYWWSTSEYNATYAWFRYFRYDGDNVIILNWQKGTGFSIRCLRD